MNKVKEIAKSHITWLVCLILCISAAMIAPDKSKAENLFEFWAFVSFCMWYWRVGG
jgi:hypothetical protein